MNEGSNPEYNLVNYEMNGKCVKPEEAQQRFTYYQGKLADPSQLTEGEKAYLINYYSYFL